MSLIQRDLQPGAAVRLPVIGSTCCTSQVESDASAGVQHWALLKGAPEVVRGFLRRVPDDYDATYRTFAAQGGRCALPCILHMKI